MPFLSPSTARPSARRRATMRGMAKTSMRRLAGIILALGSLIGCSSPANPEPDADGSTDADSSADADADGDSDVTECIPPCSPGYECFYGACVPLGPDGDADVDADVDAEADGGETLLRERACLTEFAFRPTSTVVSVQLAGEWNGWTPQAMGLDGSGVYRAEADIDPGIYCYKFIADGTWILDPVNRYRAYCGDVENSGVRVPDRVLPLLTLDGTPVTSPDGFTAHVLYDGGCGGNGPDRVTATLVHDFVESSAAATFDDGDWSLSIALSGLEPGKYTVRVEATDLAGRAAAPLLLPFWIEAEPFSWRDAAIYMVMTDRFVNGDPANDPAPTTGAEPTADWYGGDLAGITATIESGYFDDLGIRALWLSPFNTATSGTYPDSSGTHQVTGYHGYWPIEPRAVDPRLGSEDDLRALVAAAHAHGIRILMDLVVNHVHEGHVYYRTHPEWFNAGCICGTTGCDWTAERLTCLFATYMPDIDWRQEAASEQIISDALWWLESFDLDGFRMDAVKHVDDLAIFNLGTRVRETFETAGTDYYLDGETAMGWNTAGTIEANRENYDTISRYIGPDALDGQFDFVLYHAVSYRTFAYSWNGYIHADYWTVQSQLQYPAGSIMTPYLGSHDTPRFLSQSDYRGQDAAHPVDRVNNKWTDLVTPPDDVTPYERSRLGLCWLLTIPGAPMIFQGDEYGDYGGADPDNRHMFRPVASLTSWESALLDDVRSIGRARQNLAALRRGDYVSLGATEDFLPFVRQTSDGAAALVVLNGASTSQTRTVDLSGTALTTGTSLTDALGSGAAVAVVAGSATVTLPPMTCAVFTP
jgi:glycosidase